MFELNDVLSDLNQLMQEGEMQKVFEKLGENNAIFQVSGSFDIYKKIDENKRRSKFNEELFSIINWNATINIEGDMIRYYINFVESVEGEIVDGGSYFCEYKKVEDK